MFDIKNTIGCDLDDAVIKLRSDIFEYLNDENNQVEFWHEDQMNFKTSWANFDFPGYEPTFIILSEDSKHTDCNKK